MSNPFKRAIFPNITFLVRIILNIGGNLYNLRVTGPRVYNPDDNNFGVCCDDYPTPYIVMNAGIGAEPNDIINAVERFEKAYTQIIQ